MRNFFRILCLSCLFIAMLIAIFKIWADKTYFNAYDPSLPYNIHLEEKVAVTDRIEFFGAERSRNFELLRFHMDARPGEPIPVFVTLPAGRTEKIPVIIFLHGMDQGKEFLLEISAPFNEAGFAMACFDQFMQGERESAESPLQTITAFRKRPWKTVNDTRRLIDYLQTREEFDSDRIYLMGASFGAITGSTAMALDKRIRAGVLMVGGANFRLMLDSPLIREGIGNAFIRWMLTQAAVFIMKPADPVHYASGTMGRPVLMQNCSEDRLITPEAGMALYEKLGEPKEIRWYDCDHPETRPEDAPVVIQIFEEALVWLRDRDVSFLEGRRSGVVE